MKGKDKGKKGEKGKKGDKDQKHQAPKFDGNCSSRGNYGHKAKACWRNENRAKDAAALEREKSAEASGRTGGEKIKALYHEGGVQDSMLKELED